MRHIHTKNMTHAEWLELRQGGIGGSDVAAIFGLSPWRTPLQVWLDKTGRAEPKDETDAMYWGKVLEDIVATEFQRRMDFTVRRYNYMIVDDEHHMRGNVDRLIVSPGDTAAVREQIYTPYLLECKTASQYAAAEWDDGPPDHYKMQVQAYMALTGCQHAYIAVLIGSRDYRIYRVERDDQMIEAMRQYCRQWWVLHVVGDHAPDALTMADLQTLYPVSRPVTVAASSEVEDRIRDYARLVALAKGYGEDADRIKQEICAIMQDAEILTDLTGKQLVTWKSAKHSIKTDWKAAATEMAELYGKELIEKHTTEAVGSRRFLVKIKGEQ